MPGSLVRTPPVPVPVAGNGSLFKQHPIRLAGFQLRARSAAAVGTPKFEHWLAAMRFAHSASDSAAVTSRPVNGIHEVTGSIPVWSTNFLSLG